MSQHFYSVASRLADTVSCGSYMYGLGLGREKELDNLLICIVSASRTCLRVTLQGVAYLFACYTDKSTN